MYVPNQVDYDILFSKVSEIRVKIEVCNMNGTVIAVLDGIKNNGTYNIDGTSSTRRTFSSSLIPNYLQGLFINKDGIVWLDKEIKIYIGVKNGDDYIYYPCGKYMFSATNTNINPTTKEITFSATDWMSKLDGTFFGSLGNFETGSIKAYQEDENGNKIEGTEITLREAIIQVLELSNITDYDIEDIGEYAGSIKAENYLEYRKNNPSWNYLPFDIEFDNSSTVADILKSIVELYPNIDMAFDEDGILHIGYLKSNGNEDVKLTNEQVRKLITTNGEQVAYDYTQIKNVVMCVGESFDTDYFAETTTKELTSNGILYKLSINAYSLEDGDNISDDNVNGYYSNDIISFVAPSNNDNSKTFLSVNTYESIPLFDSLTGAYVEKNKLISGNTYTVKIKKILQNGVVNTYAYLLGSFQPNALCVCVDDIEKYPYSVNGNTYSTYSSLRNYFKENYNIENVNFMILKESPFTIQKIGERKTDYDGENKPTSDADAIGIAEYTLWKKVRLTETINITTKLIPWLRDDDIIEFQPNGYDSVKKYIVKNISSNIEQCTSSITMYTYYTLYNENDIEIV